MGMDGISRFGYALSEDGLTIDERLPAPIYSRKSLLMSKNSPLFNPSFGGCEDPRVARVGEEERIYVTYTAYGHNNISVAITSIELRDFLKRRWNWENEKIISPPRGPHKNFVIFPEKFHGKYAILHSITPKVSIEYLDSLEELESIKSTYLHNPEMISWETTIKGAGAPPIKTSEGWLLFHHGLGRKDSRSYMIGALLLDPKNPEEIIAKSKRPVIEPTREYEMKGLKPGVVYNCGAVVKDGTLLVYYGAADTNLCVAYSPLDEFFERLCEGKI